MGFQTASKRGVVWSISPLFAGLALLMVRNGLLGSLLGVRADIEGFPTIVIGVVMASNETRGRLLPVYMLVVTVGLGTSQLLLGLGNPLDPTLFILVGILISLAVVPIALIRIATPSQPIPVKIALLDLVRRAPLGVLAIAVTGAAGSSVFALGAVFATRIGMAPHQVGVFMAISVFGAAATQYPIGYLSDRYPRRRVMLVVATGAVVSAAVAITVNLDSAWLLVLVAVYGSLSFSMYSLAVSHINDVIPKHQLVAVAAGIVFVYGVGSVAGPLAVSILMTALGPVGYLWGLTIAFVPLVVYALVQILFRERPTQQRFISLPYRSSTAAAMLAEPSEDE